MGLQQIKKPDWLVPFYLMDGATITVISTRYPFTIIQVLGWDAKNLSLSIAHVFGHTAHFQGIKLLAFATVTYLHIRH